VRHVTVGCENRSGFILRAGIDSLWATKPIRVDAVVSSSHGRLMRRLSVGGGDARPQHGAE
jgi:hypothetical protein